MTYTKVGPFTDNSASPPINAAFLNGVENSLVGLNAVQAPAPSGGNDTTVLNNLIATAAATGGTVQLQAGTYNANILGPVGSTQASLRGMGRKQTIIRAVTNTAPVVKYRGGSGPVNGGGLWHLSLEAAAGGGGTALEFSGVTTCTAEDIDIFAAGSDTFATGVLFHNDTSGSFTEFCTFQGTINNTVTPVRYTVTSGNESFHGSGIVGNSILGTVPASTSPIIQIDSGIALPYNAPASFDCFFTNAAQVLFSNGNTTAGRSASFYGTVRAEMSSGLGPVTVATGNNAIFYVGGIIMFGGNYSSLGRLYLVDKVNYDGTNNVVLAQLRPISSYNTLTSGTSTLTSGVPYGGGMCHVAATIVGPNYYQAYVMDIWQSNTSSGGAVKNVTQMQGVDSGTTAVGVPVFGWGNYGLQVTNANYSSAFTATVSIQPLDFGTYGRSALTQ